MGKKKFRKGDLNWAERNLVYPLARGADLAANDWFGERGLARGLTQRAGLPAYEEAFSDQDDNDFANFAAEVPRAILAAGPLGPAAMGGRTASVINAGALAGAARDPGEGTQKQQSEARVWNTIIGGGLPAGMAVLGPATGRFAYKVYHRLAHPAANEALRRFIGSTDEAGAMLKSDPAAFGRAAETLPRYHGTTYRANPADAFNDTLQNLEVGQTFTPGRVMSSSVKQEVADGGFFSAPGEGFAGNRGAFITIKNKSGRDARYLQPAEGEVMTNPNASFKVTSVTRDPKTGSVTHIELEEIGPDVGVVRRVAQGVLESGRPLSAAATYPTVMPKSEKARENLRAKEKAELERRARIKGRPISKGRERLVSAIREGDFKERQRVARGE